MLLKYALRLMAYEQRLQGITQPCPKELRAFFFYLLEDTPPFRMCIGFPFILTPAVIMFLIGLLLFLIHLNSLVAGLAFLCVELPILFFLFVIIVPYWEVILRNHRNSFAPRILDSERAAVQQREWDVSVLTSADKIVQRDDVKLLAIAQDCLAETVPEDVYSYLRHILPRRSGIGWEVLSSLKDAPDYLYDNVPEATLREVGKMLVDLVKRVLRGGPKHWDDLDEGVSFLAQIESWNLLEGFPELFGSITAISVEYAKGVVEALSDSGWTFVPRLVSSEGE